MAMFFFQDFRKTLILEASSWSISYSKYHGIGLVLWKPGPHVKFFFRAQLN